MKPNNFVKIIDFKLLSLNVNDFIVKKGFNFEKNTKRKYTSCKIAKCPAFTCFKIFTNVRFDLCKIVTFF